MSQKLRVGVLFGGKSAEKEVSLATGRYIYSLLDQEKFTGTPIYMDGQGQIWHIPDKLILQNTTRDVETRLKETTKLKFEDLKGKIDVIFIAILGKYGEDGCIQGVLELLKIPYTGSGILASSVGMDKKIHKTLLKRNGFNLPKDVLVRKFDWNSRQKQYLDAISQFGLPVVVKPTREGSSIGVSVVKKTEHLAPAIDKAFQWDREVLIEEYINGMEFTCVVYGNDNPKALLPTEVVFPGDYFDYESKYMPGKTQTITPARVGEDMIKKIQAVAEQVYKLVGIKGYGRVDGYVVDDKIYVAEPHTGTIMVPSSFVFQQAAQHQIQLESQYRGPKKGTVPMSPKLLISKIIAMALEAHKHKKGLL